MTTTAEVEMEMNSEHITTDSIVDLIFHLKWKSEHATHTDGYQASRVNVWRDYLPGALLNNLIDRAAGDRFEMPVEKNVSAAAFDPNELRVIQTNQFDRRLTRDAVSKPRLGRFYPKGKLKGIAGVFKTNVQPFRCVALNNGHMTVDFNHPLAGKALDLSTVIGKVDLKQTERGGTSIDWLETLTSGPGMQARWQSQQTDYFSSDAFKREDDRLDGEFYGKPRFVHHIDETAREMVANTYGRFIDDGMQVLDLMSSWESHLPDGLDSPRLVGLGLNEDELKKNSRLNDYLVHDLNVDTVLPFASDTFDVVINTASVEYLTDPLAVFREVSRILRPDGYFIITFSNRWFPTKAIGIWKELHEFERMGLVLEYFLRSGEFKNLQTYSMRGLPRPHDDKYFPELMFSDPVYAVWGQNRKELD
jgi:SAM-dependent methyltransferase/FKBP-type peptidyl-prolyl cis-trans isomerase 2